MESELPSVPHPEEASDADFPRPETQQKKNIKPLVLLATFAALFAGCTEKTSAPALAPITKTHPIESKKVIASSLSECIHQYASRGEKELAEVQSVVGSLELGGADNPPIFKGTIRINIAGERMDIDGIPTEIFDETDYENFPEVNRYFGSFYKLSPFLKACTEWMFHHGNVQEKEIAEQIMFRKVNGRVIGKK